MILDVKYAARSAVQTTVSSALVSLQPNLAREAVSFDAAMKHPLRFREAISALHDIVVSDLRFKPRTENREACEKWKAEQARLEREVVREARKRLTEEIMARRGMVRADLEKAYGKARNQYWNARLKLSEQWRRNNPELWRLTTPCDPVVTVANDVLFFECFSADESSYGCLTVARDAFGESGSTQLGTTNVDFSWELFDRFQSLRTYRETRLRLAPEGVGVRTDGAPEYLEEKIDLPRGWLRGFLQVQAAMTLPLRRVSLGRDAVYAIAAFLRRHREARSPRALRFELVGGRVPELVLEPWEKRLSAGGAPYDGPPTEPIRIWGKRRLVSLARVLPLADRVDVYLLGTGLPSFWVVRMGEMRLTLGLSGWTSNDWTASSAIDALLPPAALSRDTLGPIAEALRSERRLDLGTLSRFGATDDAHAAAALNALAHRGQAIFDIHDGVYRWRSVMPTAVAEGELGEENVEVAKSRELVSKTSVQSAKSLDKAGTLITGVVGNTPVEVLVDADGMIKRGKCTCSHHFKNGIRMGPCRHLLALRSANSTRDAAAADDWLARWKKWSAR